MRITAYAQRLLDGLDTIDWPEPLKEMQRNWIGKSKGAEVRFKAENSDIEIEVFTTRIDTIYGVTFLSLAPEPYHTTTVHSSWRTSMRILAMRSECSGMQRR